MQRAPQDSKWSFRTAVRSYLKTAALPLEKFGDREAKRQLAWRLNEKWRRRPVCSTIPPRVWQKYLLKRCQQPRRSLPSVNLSGEPAARGRGPGSLFLYCGSGEDNPSGGDGRYAAYCCRAVCGEGRPDGLACGPLEGPQCGDCLGTQWARPSDDQDPEVAWAEDVLRLMPVYDDRVLPEELFRVLEGTRLWTPLDFEAGPPAHRLARRDEGKEATGEWLVPFRRAPLPRNVRNGAGAPVALGANGFTVYCGRQFAKPKHIQPRLGRNSRGVEKTFLWGGHCGPLEGPQCAECRRLEDRLLA